MIGRSVTRLAELLAQFFRTLFLFALAVVVVVVLFDVVVAVLDALGVLLALGRWHVRLLVEVVEQEVEEDGVRQREDDRPARVAALVPQQLRRMQECQAELDLFSISPRRGEGESEWGKT